MLARPPIDDTSWTVENKDLIVWLMSKLTPQERDIIWLYEVEELSMAEIGEIVGEKYHGRPITRIAVGYRRVRILEKLRKLLAEAS